MVVTLLVVNLLALLAVLLLLWDQRRRARTVLDGYVELGAAPVLPPDLAASFESGKRRVIVLEILNPLELAATESRFGGVAGGMAPAATRKVVVERAVKRLQEQLAGEGVIAEVSVHVAG